MLFCPSETALWTNPSPNNSYGYDTVTLSQSLESFKYIKAKYYDNTTSKTELSVLMPVADIKKVYAASGGNLAMCAPYSTGAFLRFLGFRSATSVWISNAVYVDSPGTAQPSYIIPVAIYGVT